ncbi:MAG: PKD domain-containing protein [Candidatus Natronoplasma sp.]
MKSGKLNKMATILAVLFLIMSGLMVVQWNAQPVEATEHEDEDYTYTIEGFIDTEEYVPIESDLEIKLRSLSTGETWNEHTSEDYYEFTDVKPGRYEIILPSQIEDDVAYMRTTTDQIEISDEDVTRDLAVDNEYIDHELQFNVTIDNDPVEELEDVTITLQNRTRGFHYDDYDLICEENSTVEIDIYKGFSGSLMVEKEGYAPNFTHPVDLDEGSEKTILEDISLETTPIVQGRLMDQKGSGIQEDMDITLYNETVGVLNRTKEGPTFRIRAPINYDYTLVVDAPGYRPLVNDSISFDEDREIRLDKNTVYESEPEEFHTDIHFDYDIDTEKDNLTVTTNRNIRAGTRMETLDYSSMGNLAMQIDLALGDGDGHLNDTDVEKFKERLNYTKNIKHTPEFITVNDTVFELKDYTAEFSENFTDKLTGDINASNLFEGDIYFDTTRTYEPVNTGPGRHIIDLTVEHDQTYGNKRDYTYEMTLREDYERYRGEGTEEDIPENVEVKNYTELTIDPETVDLEEDLRSKVTLDIRESEEGEVDILVNPDDDNEVRPHIFEKEEDEEVDWVIRKGTNVTFEADYTPVTSEAISYTWTYGDRDPVYGEDQIEFSHIFDETTGEDDWEILNLKVEESSGEMIDDSINIVVDDEGPRGEHIIVNEENIDLGHSTNVDEQEEVEFSASDFHDNATGDVAEYKWTFNYTEEHDEAHDEGENITHAFDVPGEYEVSLNVTDIVGNWRTVSIDVTVMDVTEPEGDFSIEWNDNSTYEPTVRLQKEINVTFNGTEIVAHPDYNGESVDFNWTLIDEDGNKTLAENEEALWTYDGFTEAGTYTIRLNVTDGPSDFTEDEKENYREIEKTITIERGPVPDLSVRELRFSDEDPRVGDTVTISVNVTNIGDSNAEDIETILRVDGERVDIDEKFYQDGEELDVHEIAKGETVTIRFEWEPEEDGENTVNVNVTDAEEPSDLHYNNDMEDTVSVRVPAWRQYLVYALIPIIIIGVTVGLYFFKDKIAELLG